MSTGRISKRYLIDTADADLYFKFGRLYREHHLQESFRKRLPVLQDQFFPGLVLKDGAGVRYRAQLVVEIKPIVPEETSVSTHMHK